MNDRGLAALLRKAADVDAEAAKLLGLHAEMISQLGSDVAKLAKYAERLTLRIEILEEKLRQRGLIE